MPEKFLFYIYCLGKWHSDDKGMIKNMRQNNEIEIVNADINNLKQLNVSFGLNQITMVVGRSGSGKSSLVEQIIAKEGNQRLDDFLHIKDKAIEPREDFAFINKLPPTVFFGQKSFRASKRTTIGTSSGVLNILQKLFIRYSAPYSTITNQVVDQPCVSSYVQWLLNHAEGCLNVWAIPLDFDEQDGRDVAKNLADAGFETMVVRSETDSAKVYEQGKVVKTHNFKGFNGRCRRIIEVNVGKCTLAANHQNNNHQNNLAELTQLLDLAFTLGKGKVLVEFQYKGCTQVEYLDSRKHRVTADDAALYVSPNKHNLTFNSPTHEQSGACQQCAGLGEVTALVLDELMNQPNLSMHQGACALYNAKNYKYINISHDTIEGLRNIAGFDPDIPWCQLPQSAQSLILDGAGDLEVFDIDPKTKKKTSAPRKFTGFRTAILARFQKQSKTSEKLGFLVAQQVCSQCNGCRWAAHTRALKLGVWHFEQLLGLDFNQLNPLFAINAELPQALDQQGQALCRQFYQLSKTFIEVGLGHLSPQRQMTNISDGESRRIRLGAVLYAQLHGICLLLDEPTRGLHEKDIGAINQALTRLRSLNTLIICDHRRKLAMVADRVLALGPQAGVNGGQLLNEQQTKQNWWDANPIDTGIEHHGQPVKAWLSIKNASYHHIHNADIDLPFGQLVTIAGVSGSGKSSFVHGILLPVLNKLVAEKQNSVVLEHVNIARCNGDIQLDNVVVLSQTAATTNRRSTIATFLDIAAQIRTAYAKQAKQTGVKLTAADFSTNGGNGRCVACLGLGQVEDVIGWQTCSRCGGTQFKPQVLNITCDELNINELSSMPIAQLLTLDIAMIQSFKPLLKFVNQLGIGHLCLGRRSCDISGGEIQRLKIAKQLVTKSPHHSLFILDEPAAGLHPIDVAQLHQTLNQLIAQGNNSVIIIEHNLALIAKADWVIEFGPECGAKGGEVIAQGAVKNLLKLDTPTAVALKEAVEVKVKIKQPSPFGYDAAPTIASSRDNINKIKALIGYDVLPSASPEQAMIKPAMVFEPSEYTHHRLLEFGGLMAQIVALALDLHQSHFNQLLDIWHGEPDAQLWINPLLNEMAVWGENIPKTIIAQYDMDVIQAKDCRAKVSFASSALISNRGTQQDLLTHGLNLGGGYVELRKSGKPLAHCATRLLDFDNSNIGPIKPLVSSYLRHHANAQCPVCKGEGTVINFDHALLFGDLNSPVENNAFLAPDLLKIFKGVYRNELLPFFRRMIKERLWPANTPINQLSNEQMQILLYGYWCRPSFGSFLKSAKADPVEVGAWLRWDGLTTQVIANQSRADVSWQQQLSKHQSKVQCARCKGSGIGRQGELLMLGELSFGAWVSTGNVNQLYDTITTITTKVQSDSQRIQSRQKQILAVLKPLVDNGFGALALNTPLLAGPWQLIIESTLQQLSTLDLLIKE